MQSRDSSDDFFSSFGNSPPTKTAGGPPARRAPPPPPPPRSGNKTTTTTTASYYNNTARASAPPPPPGSGGVRQPPSAATARRPPPAGSSRPSRPRPTGTARAPPPAGTAYGNPSTTTASTTAAARPLYSQPAAAQATPAPSYYGANFAAAAPTPAAPAPAPASNDWYTPPAPAPEPAMDWYASSQSSSVAAPAAAPVAAVPRNMNAGAFMQSSSSLEGSMDAGASNNSKSNGSIASSQQQPGMPQPSLFVPRATSSSSLPPEDDFLNEPPLLEELGVNVDHILLKSKAVVIPFRRFSSSALMDPSLIVEDADLAGPLAFALALGGELLLAGKLQFGYIYGFGLFGCVAMTIVLNLMSPTGNVSFWTVTSILGYALIPVNLLAALKLVLQNLAGFSTLTRLLAVVTVIWSTTASTRLLEIGCAMEQQRYLLAYPIALLYSAFVLITIF